MKTTWTTALFFPALLAGVALVAAGCAESTTREDVAESRQDLQEEKQDVAETRAEAQDEIADARREAQPYTVNKPVTGEAGDDDAVEARQDVAEAQHEAKQDIRDEKQDVAEAAAELRTTEQKAAATKARDEFVAQIERTLADVQARIDQLKQSASSAEGSAKENIDRQIDDLESQHDRVEEALDNLKTAELSEWQNHRQHVRTAMQELNNNLNMVR